MLIREYITCDCKQLAELFYQTVHAVNAKDYTKEQLDVWATGNVDLKEWDKSYYLFVTLNKPHSRLTESGVKLRLREMGRS